MSMETKPEAIDPGDGSVWTTFRYADPNFDVGGEFAFGTDVEYFGNDIDPLDVVIERWELVERTVVSEEYLDLHESDPRTVLGVELGILERSLIRGLGDPIYRLADRLARIESSVRRFVKGLR